MDYEGTSFLVSQYAASWLICTKNRRIIKLISLNYLNIKPIVHAIFLAKLNILPQLNTRKNILIYEFF